VTTDEDLAVLRHMAADEGEADAYVELAGELATLRVQRQEALELATAWEQAAWRRGGDHGVREMVRVLREVLGAPR
jgi:hypothetical protein